MKLAIATALAFVTFAAPGSATAGLQCRPVGNGGPVLNIVLGEGPVRAVTGISLHERHRILTTPHRPDGDPLVIAQSWIDHQHLWMDLVDAEGIRYEGKLRARFNQRLRGRPAIGTLTRNGRTYHVRCKEG